MAELSQGELSCLRFSTLGHHVQCTNIMYSVAENFSICIHTDRKILNKVSFISRYSSEFEKIKLKCSKYACLPDALREIFSDCFQIWINLIVVTVFLLIMNPSGFRWIHSQKENCHYDHIRWYLKLVRKLFLSVWIFGTIDDQIFGRVYTSINIIEIIRAKFQ